MAAPEFSHLVTLACHDLSTPLATVNGFAKTLLRTGDLDENGERFIGMIAAAAEQMNDLLDLLRLAARIESGRYEPALSEVDTLELVRSNDDRVEVDGLGETVETDATAVRRALAALASAAIRHGEVEEVTWTINGRECELSRVTQTAGAVVTGNEPKDLGALVARIAIEQLGGTMDLTGETLHVRL